MPEERKRRDAIPNRQYDVFQSTDYTLVNIGEVKVMDDDKSIVSVLQSKCGLHIAVVIYVHCGKGINSFLRLRT